MSKYINIYSVLFLYLFIGILKIVYFIYVPEYSIDAVWTATGAYANLRGEFWTDSVAGFRFPNLYSYFVSFVLLITGNTNYSLHIWYILLPICFGISIYYLFNKKFQNNTLTNLLISLAFSNDILVSNERPELFCMLFLFVWILMVKDFNYKHSIGLLISFLLHPVTCVFYGLYILMNEKVSVKQYLLGGLVFLVLFVFNAESTSLWLQTLYIRIQSEHLFQQINDAKYLLLFQLTVCVVIYSSKNFKKYITQIIPVFIAMLMLGKPYYFAYINLFSLLFLYTHSIHFSRIGQYITAIVFLLNVYITVLFPWINHVVLNPNYGAFIKRRNDILQGQAKIVKNALLPLDIAIPFLVEKSQFKVFDQNNLKRTVRKKETNEMVYTAQVENINQSEYTITEILKPLEFTEYSLLLTKTKKTKWGLYKIE